MPFDYTLTESNLTSSTSCSRPSQTVYHFNLTSPSTYMTYPHAIAMSFLSTKIYFFNGAA